MYSAAGYNIGNYPSRWSADRLLDGHQPGAENESLGLRSVALFEWAFVRHGGCFHLDRPRECDMRRWAGHSGWSSVANGPPTPFLVRVRATDGCCSIQLSHCTALHCTALSRSLDPIASHGSSECRHAALLPRSPSSLAAARVAVHVSYSILFSPLHLRQLSFGQCRHRRL